MPPRLLTRSAGAVAQRMPVLRRIPVLRILAVAEVAMLAREHVTRLDPQERRRLLELVRIGRGRRRNLSDAERDELAILVVKMQPRTFAGAAVERFSPVPLPRALLYGRGNR